MAWLLGQLLSRGLSAGRKLSGQFLSGQPRSPKNARILRQYTWPSFCSLPRVIRTEASAGAKSAAGANQGGLEWGLEGRRLDTQGGAFSSLSLPRLALLLGVLGGACRPHVAVCDGDCDDALTPASSNGGAAGAGDDDSLSDERGGSGSSEAGAPAAGAPSAECQRARDCDDGIFCNGDEGCLDGACVPGTEVACDDGTTCVEREAEAACVYAEPSPWLLLLTNREIKGLPTAEMGKRPLLTLGERPTDNIFVGYNDVTFSPDGAHALIDYLLPDFGQQVLELSFGDGVPKAAEGVKNLPNWGSYSVPTFSYDGKRALLYEGGSGAYALDLSQPVAVPSSLPLPFFYGWEISFCQSPNEWLIGSTPATLYSLESGEVHPTEVGGEVVAVSPDGQKVWLRGEDPRLASCSARPELGPLGLPDGDGSWSPDSRWLLVKLDDYSAKLFSVSDTLETTEVWSTEGLDSYSWATDGRALLVHRDEDPEAPFVYLDLTVEAPLEQELALPDDARIDYCEADGCLVFVPRADETLDLLWQPFSTHVAPTILTTQLAAESDLQWADLAHDRLLLQRAADAGSKLTLADLETSSEQVVFEWPGSSLDALPAPDGSGVHLRISDDTGYSSFWLTLPMAGSDAAPSVVPLDVPAYRRAFQPWPRQAP